MLLRKVFGTMFRQNLESVMEKFNSAMDMQTGKNLLVRDVFTAIEKLESGEFQTITEMLEKSGFNAQNTVFNSVQKMLRDMGTPLKSLSKTKRTRMLSGNAFAKSLMNQLGS